MAARRRRRRRSYVQFYAGGGCQTTMYGVRRLGVIAPAVKCVHTQTGQVGGEVNNSAAGPWEPGYTRRGGRLR